MVVRWVVSTTLLVPAFRSGVKPETSPAPSLLTSPIARSRRRASSTATNILASKIRVIPRNLRLSRPRCSGSYRRWERKVTRDVNIEDCPNTTLLSCHHSVSPRVTVLMAYRFYFQMATHHSLNYSPWCVEKANRSWGLFDVSVMIGDGVLRPLYKTKAGVRGCGVQSRQ